MVSGRSGRPVEAAAGLADVATGRPFTPTTSADAGSLAKTMTAALVWQAHVAGALDVAEPVATYLPGLPADITVEDLLTHRTGGLPDYDWYFSHLATDDCLTNRRLLELTVSHAWQRGRDRDDSFDYDSTGYDLAALVVERALGAPYGDLLAERVAEPLGMTDTFVRPARLADWPGVRTRGYRPGPDGWLDHDVEDREGFHGGSNVWSSARDLHRWGRSLAEGDVSPPPAHEPLVYPSGARGVLDRSSWYVTGEGSTRHYPGALQGFFALVLVDRDSGSCISLVSNSGVPHLLRMPLVRMLREVAAGRPATVPHQAQDVAAGIDLRDRLGAHAEGGDSVELILDTEGHVRLRPDGGPAYQVFRLEDTTWYVPGLDRYLSWTHDGRLRVDGVDGERLLGRTAGRA